MAHSQCDDLAPSQGQYQPLRKGLYYRGFPTIDYTPVPPVYAFSSVPNVFHQHLTVVFSITLKL